MVELVVRLVFSLAVVLGMLILLARFGAKRFRGGRGGLVQVVHRQALSRTSAISVVTVGSRVLVLGTTEHQVRLLTELEPEELEDLDVHLSLAGPADEDDTDDSDDSDEVDVVRPRPVAVAARASDGALAGSILSAQTWKQAFAAATRKDKEAS